MRQPGKIFDGYRSFFVLVKGEKYPIMVLSKEDLRKGGSVWKTSCPTGTIRN